MRFFLYLAWLISLIGFCVSIYFGEILELEPCRLCWYQRIALFPLALLLGIAAYRGDRSFASYGILLAFVGFAFSLYQWLQGIFPALHSDRLCGPVKSCSDQVFELFGFLTLPLLSVIGFTLIIASLFAARKKQ